MTARVKIKVESDKGMHIELFSVVWKREEEVFGKALQKMRDMRERRYNCKTTLKIDFNHQPASGQAEDPERFRMN